MATIEMMIDPVLMDIETSFESERMLLGAPRAGDGAAIYEATVESLAELRPWMRWVHDEPSVDDSEKSVRRSMAQWILREDMRFSMHDKRTDRFIGGTGLHRPRCNDRLFEIGYWVRTSEANKGYVTETVRALTRWAFAAL